MRNRGVMGGRLGSLVAIGSLLVLCAAVVGCRGSRRQVVDRMPSEAGDEIVMHGTPAQRPTEPPPVPSDWPRVLVIGPGSGPALFLGPDQNARAFGYLNPGARVRLESGPMDERIQVLVGGGLSTKGWIPRTRLAAYAQTRGRIEGTRTYVGPGDFLGVLGPAAPGQMTVEVRPWLGGTRYLGPFVGTFASESIAAELPSEDAEGPTAGDCYRLPEGQSVPVYERPGGEPFVSLPALDPPAVVVVLRQQGDWYGVRAGHGPYITGYVSAALTPCAGGVPTPQPPVASGGERPVWVEGEPGALYRVAEGTNVSFAGQVIARLRTAGWAREQGRPNDEQVDVFVAVDDSVAIRGLVPASALTLVEGEPAGSTPAPPEPEELPDELM